MKITLFIPVLNEIDGLKQIMPRVPHDLFCQILIVDGGSADGTLEWAKSQGYDTYRQIRPGLRHAYSEGFPLIRGDHVLTFSPDGNCIPEDIPLILNRIAQGFDMVIASRYLAGSRSDDDDWLTAFGNRFFTGLINRIFAARYTDTMTIYRSYRTQMFFDLKLQDDHSYWPENYLHTVVGIEPLLSIRAAKSHLLVSEIASVEPKRIAGERKLQIWRWGTVHLVQILTEALDSAK